MLGTWEFVEVRGDITQHFTFALTSAKATRTCIAGDWRQAKLLSPHNEQVSNPAYKFESGELEVLLYTGICDSYNVFSGTVSGNSFTGVHGAYGLGGGTTLGNVTGTRRR